MKNFSDLVFEAHPVFPDATLARIDFSNGYGLSVVTGQYAYTSKARPYEVAIALNGAICYDTPLTDDVLGYETADSITEIMAQVAAFAKP